MTCKNHELYEEEYTFNMKGEMVLVCQKCYAEIPITLLTDSEGKK